MVHARQCRLEQAADFFVGNPTRPETVDGGGDQRLAGAQLVGGFLGAPVRGHECTRPVAQLDHALVLELAVGLGDRVGVDHELLRERANAGQLFAGA